MRATQEDRLRAGYRRHNQGLAEAFEAIVEMDRSESYREDGARGTADWVCCAFGLGVRLAREWVRVAKALDYLPAILDAFRDGDLSYEKVVCLASHATPDEDAELAREAIGWTASDTKLWAAYRRRGAKALSNKRYSRRSLRILKDPVDGFVRLWGRLPEDMGLTFAQTIEWMASQMLPNPNNGLYDPFDVRCADALVMLAAREAGIGSKTDRPMVVAYVDAETVSSPEAVGTLAGGMAVASETITRLLCDSRLQAAVKGGDGEVVAYSPAARTAPPALRRRLFDRDRGCAFPGCNSHGPFYAHHMTHYAHGGRTTERNLVLVCWFHHRLVHEGGWQCRWMGPLVEFVRPDGRPISLGARAGPAP